MHSKSLFARIIATILVIFSFPIGTFAAPGDTFDWSQYMNSVSDSDLARSLTLQGLFQFYSDIEGVGIPGSYQYIQLKYTNIPTNTIAYTILQKCVYLGVIDNLPMSLDLSTPATEDMLQRMVYRQYAANLQIQA